MFSVLHSRNRNAKQGMKHLPQSEQLCFWRRADISMLTQTRYRPHLFGDLLIPQSSFVVRELLAFIVESSLRSFYCVIANF